MPVEDFPGSGASSPSLSSPGEAAPAARCKRGGHGAPASDFVPRETESRPWLAQSLLWRCVCYQESRGEDKPRSIAKEYGEVCCGVQSPSTVLSRGERTS
jgi:hypothetical protein